MFTSQQLQPAAMQQFNRFVHAPAVLQLDVATVVWIEVLVHTAAEETEWPLIQFAKSTG